MRGMERELERVRSKVDELWAQFPRLGQILAPLEIHIQNVNNVESGRPKMTDMSSEEFPTGAVSVRAQTPVEALKPLSKLIEGTLEKSINELRHDLMSSFDDVKGALATKSNEFQMEGRQLHDKVTQLQGQVDELSRPPSRVNVKSLPSARWVTPDSTIAFRSSVVNREKATNAAMANADVG